MSDKIFKKLIIKFNDYPLGVSKIRELEKMLRILFTNTEAKIALNLKPHPESIDVLAQRACIPKNFLIKILETMSNKGLVYSKKNSTKKFYADIRSFRRSRIGSRL